MIQKLLRCIGTANGDRGKEFPVPENKGWLYNDLIKSFNKRKYTEKNSREVSSRHEVAHVCPS